MLLLECFIHMVRGGLYRFSSPQSSPPVFRCLREPLHHQKACQQRRRRPAKISAEFRPLWPVEPAGNGLVAGRTHRSTVEFGHQISAAGQIAERELGGAATFDFEPLSLSNLIWTVGSSWFFKSWLNLINPSLSFSSLNYVGPISCTQISKNTLE